MKLSSTQEGWVKLPFRSTEKGEKVRGYVLHGSDTKTKEVGLELLKQYRHERKAKFEKVKFEFDTDDFMELWDLQPVLVKKGSSFSLMTFFDFAAQVRAPSG